MVRLRWCYEDASGVLGKDLLPHDSHGEIRRCSVDQRVRLEQYHLLRDDFNGQARLFQRLPLEHFLDGYYVDVEQVNIECLSRFVLRVKDFQKIVVRVVCTLLLLLLQCFGSAGPSSRQLKREEISDNPAAVPLVEAAIERHRRGVDLRISK